ncbi:MAG: dethiobiotin synthase [Methylococcales bacterium]|jgi:dethiobiotin synthetase|nr:dethiobiotin synthase [Methylococcales bacterium]MCX7076151.1 dethiobiotin synthase [Methylococcales bacterium]
MKQGYFITGTDTNVGKTWVTLALMTYFKQQNLSVVGMKPVASGCEKIDNHWRNADALSIQQCNSQWLDYDLINPYAYELPISPHLAGKSNPADFTIVLSQFHTLQTLADVVIVEGAGGWYAPLNAAQTIADLAQALQLPVILVVSIKLGCINHAQLSVDAIEKAQLTCAGWVAVCNDVEFNCIDATIEALVERLPMPLLSVMPYLDEEDFDYLAATIHF